MKTCTKCGESKPTTEFSKNSCSRDGLRSYCRSCAANMLAAWRKENTDKARALFAKWALDNPEKNKARKAKWRVENPDKVNAIYAKWAAAHPEKVRASSIRWKAANRDKVNASAAKRYADNPERQRASNIKWTAANKEATRIIKQNRRARERANGGRLSPGLVGKLLKLQRGKCACGCKQPLGTDYHLDHRMPLALGGLNTDENIQLLRAKCNMQKSAKHPVDFMQQRGYLI